MKTSSPVWHRIIAPATDPQTDPEITSIHASAQDVKPGGLFIAIKGFKADGHDYIDEAIANGAVAVVTGKPIHRKGCPVVMAEVKESRKAMSAISARFYNDPSREMVLIGITGTNGKTTTAWIVESILTRAGHTVGVIGTVNYRYNGKRFDNPITTPESIDLHRILADMKHAGVTHVVMEVSSHAIDLHRVRDCHFDIAVFTNLTRDHLDYHNTMGAYFASKKRLFTRLLNRSAAATASNIPGNTFSKFTEDTVATHPKTNITTDTTSKTTQDITEKSPTNLVLKKGIAIVNLESPYGLKLAEALPKGTTITTTIRSNTNPEPEIESKPAIEQTPHQMATCEIEQMPHQMATCETATNRDTHSKNDAEPYLGSLWATDVQDTINGLEASLHFGEDLFIPFHSKLTGRFNLENILCATGAAHALGIAPHLIVAGIEACEGVPGRLERVENRGNRHIFVDYAHTPDALESTLKTLKTRAPARLITLFGCGGDRDATKRPIMGEIAARYSDIIIVTSDNPRTEDPDAIIEDIMVGVKNIRNSVEIWVEVDRKKALHLAIELSQPDDIVVAAGKGHETYQVIQSGKIDFDDRLILKDACRRFDVPDGKKKTMTGMERNPSSPNGKTPNMETVENDLQDPKPIPWSFNDVRQALYTKMEDLKTPLKHHGSRKSCSEAENEGFDPPLFSGISTDSRTTRPNDLFVALQGDRFDGHDFISDLMEKGVKGFIVSNQSELPSAPSRFRSIHFFPVENTLEALGKLARYQRLRASVKVVALTGSSGKTTTRQMISSIFEEAFCTLSTKGNFNNEIGLPLTLLRLSQDHQWAVVEMGMNHSGEISRLSRIACPDIALITNTAAAHLEGMGDVNHVAKAKAEITHGMLPGSTLILNEDDPRMPMIMAMAKTNPNIGRTLFFTKTEKRNPTDDAIKTDPINTDAAPIISTSTSPSDPVSRITAESIIMDAQSVSFILSRDADPSEKERCPITIHSPAPFMIDNALAASAVALTAGIPMETIQKGLSRFIPVAGRMNIIHKKGVWLIDDTYNANPASVKGALETLKQMKEKRLREKREKDEGHNDAALKPKEEIDVWIPLETIAVLGDMLELGKESGTLHADVGKAAAKSDISQLFCFGQEASEIARGAESAGFPSDKILWASKEEICQRLISFLIAKEAEKRDQTAASPSPPIPHTAILIKGSRGMKMEEILETLSIQIQ